MNPEITNTNEPQSAQVDPFSSLEGPASFAARTRSWVHYATPPVVTIDGPAGAGKTTLGLKLAQHYGVRLVDSGSLFRAVALAAIERGIEVDNANGYELGRLTRAVKVDFTIEKSVDGSPRLKTYLDGRDVSARIRDDEVSHAASILGGVDEVRNEVTAHQRNLVKEGCVTVGRMQGVEIFPEAPVKIFLVASVEERAQRRAKEKKGKQVNLDSQDVSAEVQSIVSRDSRDKDRIVKAPDALVLDTSSLTVEQTFKKAQNHIDIVLATLPVRLA